MRTTIILEDKLVQDAQRLTGIKTKTEVIRRGLQELISREYARRLAAMGGTMPNFRIPPRRRSSPT